MSAARPIVGAVPAARRPRRASRSLPGLLPEAALGEVLVWTDGACQRNPGPGGWAALVCWQDGVTEELSGGSPQTTNNIMEMTAALEGLRGVPAGSRVCVVTDSRYLHDGMTSWLSGWKRRGWTTAAGAPVKNRELWIALEAPRPGTRRCAGTGSRATSGTSSTSAPTSWPSPPRCRRRARAAA